MNKPIAIRSLQCADHARNITPEVLGACWFVGKRCNYDCSYCSPHVHDAVSPFINFAHAVVFSQDVDQYCVSHNKKMKWAFTGGETFLDPSFLDLAAQIRSLSSTYHMGVVTNGSLPVETYQHAARIFDGLTFSLHLERSSEEIHKIIRRIRQIQDCYVSVNLMMLPGRLQQIKDIVKRLQDQNTAYVVRKITPLIDDSSLLPYVQQGAGRKDLRLLDITQQGRRKALWKEKNDIHNADLPFYNEEELDYLSTANQATDWINCGTWFDNGTYQELNTDFLVANDLVQFKDWICYAGVDTIYIDFDGKIYRGLCQNKGPIGQIGEKFTFQSQPTVCQRRWCHCNFDIAVRKSTPDHVTHIR